MKKILLFFILSLLVLLTFTGCSGKLYSFKESIDEIESIEIVSAESSLDYAVVKTLSETEKNDFLQQFQKIEFNKYLGDPPGVHGDSIKITYQSGFYEIICYFDSEYVKNGITQFGWNRCDEESFNNLINDFSGDGLP